MNTHEIERIADAMHRLRPDWPAASLRTLITKNLADRPRRDVAVALAWVACESGTSTPARVLGTGPWWRAAGVEGGATQREPYDRGGTCATCSLPHEKCRRVWADDHPYISVHEYAKTVNHDPERIKRIIEAAKGEKVPMREPSTPRAAEVVDRDHADCDAAIEAAMTAGRDGEAEYLATRCDMQHGQLAEITPAADREQIHETTGADA